MATDTSDDEGIVVDRPRRSLSMPKFDGFSARSFTELSEPSSPQYPGTPSLSTTAAELRRNLSIKGLSEMDGAAWRARLWRPKSIERRPQDLDQLIAWAVRGGSRAFFQAYTARTFFNLVILLLTALRKRKAFTKKMILNALFGETAIRFGVMFGTFAAIYRWTFHGLRLYNPGPRGKGKEERWHAAAAGALASAALMAERPSARVTLAQQILVRGLQGVYHRFRKRGLNIPNGDVLLFGLACGQIMYAWVMAPVALSRDYRSWITRASNLPPTLTRIQRRRVFGLPLHVESAEFTRDTWRDITATNMKTIETSIQSALKGNNGPPYAPCAFHHPDSTSCVTSLVKLWPKVARWSMPVYAALHFVPPIILRYRAFAADPTKFLKRSTTGTLRSSAFLASFVTIYSALICQQRSIYDFFKRYNFDALASASMHHLWCWVFGFSTCLSLFFEEKRRREELAVYVLPKALESAWIVLRLQKLVPASLPGGGANWLSAIGLAILMDCWRHEREALSSLVRALLWQSAG